MCLNMDRNSLWGSAGGMVFVSAESWDVQDRLNWVDRTTGETLEHAAKTILPSGDGIGLFNQLNWKRNDPVALKMTSGTTLPAPPANCSRTRRFCASWKCHPQALAVGKSRPG